MAVNIDSAYDSVFGELKGEFPATLAASGSEGDSFTAEVTKTYDELDIGGLDEAHGNSFYAIIEYDGDQKQSNTVNASLTVTTPWLSIRFICYDPGVPDVTMPSYRWGRSTTQPPVMTMPTFTRSATSETKAMAPPRRG